MITDQTAQQLYRQIKMAAKDQKVRGLILQIDSPGGTIAASDRIYNEISKYRRQTKKPVIAFLQGMGTSGGYYVAAACEKIVAEPTAVTGSIGVIMGHFVLQGLLQDKLGIEPVIIKSGQKKDWPSPFQQTSPEQRQYIMDKLITPAYERFIKIVAQARTALTVDQVRQLADGSIYGADEALENKLIDGIGYIDQAIEQIMRMAKLEQAQVVEYRRPFSLLSGLFGETAESMLKIDAARIYELAQPKLLYLWNASW